MSSLSKRLSLSAVQSDNLDNCDNDADAGAQCSLSHSESALSLQRFRSSASSADRSSNSLLSLSAEDVTTAANSEHSMVAVETTSLPAAAAAANGSSSKETSSRSEKKVGDPTPLSAAKKRRSKAGSHLRNLLAPTYKTRNAEMKRLFELPDGEKLVVDYSCAYQKEILLHGRLYLSQNWFCFYSNIFKWETMVKMNYRDIVNVTKERTAKIIPNAIYVTTANSDRLFFTSFSARDKTFMMLFRLWQLALLDQVVAPVEMWSWARHGYDETDLYESSDENDDDGQSVEVLSSIVDQDLYTTSTATVDLRKRHNKCSEKRGFDQVNRPTFQLDNKASEGPCANGAKVQPAAAATEGGRGRLGSKCHSLGDVRTARSNHTRQQQTTTTPPRQICSDSSENEEDEVLCPCATHEGREFVNSVYPLSVDQLFLWLFTDSDFFQQFQNLRKTKNLILSDWKIDKNTKAKLRQISYSVAVNHALAPKSCEVVEKQECMECSKAGHIYVIKVEVQNFGIPYSDVFQVMLSYCLTRLSPSQSRLRINGKIVYKKSCWGIIKSVIEKNALYNMLNHFTDLDNLLRYECHQLGLSSVVPMDQNQVCVVENKIAESMTASQLNIPSRQNAESLLERSNLETYLRAIVILLLLLVSIGLLVLYNQWNAAAAWKANCDSQVLEALTHQLRRMLVEE